MNQPKSPYRQENRNASDEIQDDEDEFCVRYSVPIRKTRVGHYSSDHHEEVISTCDINIEQEAQEVGIVIMTHAVVDPRTMVI